METFSYTAVAATGKEKKGSIEAENRDEAARQLKTEGYTPIVIKSQNFLDKDLSLSFGLGVKKVKTRDLSVFCRQFSSILKAGVSVISALEMLSEQTENKSLRQALKNVQSNVEKGENLADAMRLEGNVFPPLLINMISAGESSGSLEISIERMAIQFEKDAKLKGMVKKAMMYPMVLCFVAIGVVIVMMAFVIPSFMKMFEDMEESMPPFTQFVINMSNFITQKWYLLIAIVVAVVVGYNTYAKTDNGLHTIASIKLKIPVFGTLVTKTACARFSRTFGTLLAAGMPMIDALDITAKTMDNVKFKEALMKVKSGVGLGLSLSTQLRASNLFPSMVIHMTNIGEETGNLEEMLNNVANYYDEEVEITTQQVTALMEPMIILVMAAIVCGLIMAIYSPMIQLYNTLG
ncbi:type II secretion system F family protein [[Clostridium] fimetarium]|uniref:Type IV pilus assembly protein PilC n=1 Tax=[Clostridium] fimetarium TaxID=99656 RepID=A0A1I0N0L9_9FIRM|nr:type II secretion system F family protein [[Clostridium] fimetarium]SEV94365.1 type IV pilus assembly protein PilC [[Clostridium] fimetarium]